MRFRGILYWTCGGQLFFLANPQLALIHSVFHSPISLDPQLGMVFVHSDGIFCHASGVSLGIDATEESVARIFFVGGATPVLVRD